MCDKCTHKPFKYIKILLIINSVEPARASTWGHPTTAYLALLARSLWETLQVLNVCVCDGERGRLGKKASKIERGKERGQDAES
jgi:hypothetical protein